MSILVYNRSLTEGAEDLPLQIVVNFKANDPLEEAQAGGYGDWQLEIQNGTILQNLL